MTSDLCWTFFSNGSLFRECPARSFPMHCNGDQDFFCPALAIFDLLPSWGGLQTTFYHLNKRICNLDKYILQFRQIHFIIWTNTFGNLDKYILQLGKIHSVIWTNTRRRVQTLLGVSHRSLTSHNAGPHKLVSTL